MSDDAPSIDLTSEADQSFMDADAEPEETDYAEMFIKRVWRYRENGWDTSGLRAPEEFDGEGPEDVPEHAERDASDEADPDPSERDS